MGGEVHLMAQRADPDQLRADTDRLLAERQALRSWEDGGRPSAPPGPPGRPAGFVSFSANPVRAPRLVLLGSRTPGGAVASSRARAASA